MNEKCNEQYEKNTFVSVESDFMHKQDDVKMSSLFLVFVKVTIFTENVFL